MAYPRTGDLGYVAMEATADAGPTEDLRLMYFPSTECRPTNADASAQTDRGTTLEELSAGPLP